MKKMVKVVMIGTGITVVVAATVAVVSHILGKRCERCLCGADEDFWSYLDDEDLCDCDDEPCEQSNGSIMNQDGDVSSIENKNV